MELNPNNPVARAANGQWHKIAALIMHKLGVNHVEIREEDAEALAAKGLNIGIADDKGYMEVFLLTSEQTKAMLKKHKGTVEDA
jgi:hypothetical protein